MYKRHWKAVLSSYLEHVVGEEIPVMGHEGFSAVCLREIGTHPHHNMVS